jgi:hypothetical protein
MFSFPPNLTFQGGNNNNNQQMGQQPRYSNHRSSYHHHVSPQQAPPPPQYHNNPAFYQGGHYEHYNKQRSQPPAPPQQHSNTITINDTPSPTSVILISDSEDEEENGNGQKNVTRASTSTQCNNVKEGVIATSSSRQQHRKNVISCVTVGDSDGEDSAPKNHQHVKYEQSQKKRNLAENTPQGPSSANLKQEPAEFLFNQFEYPPYDHQKRSSWVGPPVAHAHNHHMNNKRDATGSNNVAVPPPPVAHIKNNEVPPVSSSSTSNTTPIYHHHHHHPRTQPQQPQNTTPLGNSPIGTTAALLQPQQADIYTQAELYRRPTVFVSQASYAYNTARVVPPPAHNGNSRQVSF